MLLGMTEHRRAAVEGLYAAFGHVPRPARVEGCPQAGRRRPARLAGR
jgi:hypothetical protein